MKMKSNTFKRLVTIFCFVLFLTGFFLLTTEASLVFAQGSSQPQLKAPWRGKTVITQGNRASYSHNECGRRSYYPNDCAWENTYALDIRMSVGTDILAPADGRISFIKTTLSGGGRELGLEVTGPTGNKFEIIFLHLSEFAVQAGNIVRQGDLIAKSGTSANGSNTGASPHLHFHMWSGSGSRDSHTMPIERLVLGDSSGFREYNARNGDLDNTRVGGKTFDSNNNVNTSAYEGFLDGVDCDTIRGWAWDSTQPNTPVDVDIYDGPNLVVRATRADKFRQDLLDNNKGNGRHAFDIPTPASLKDGQPHSIWVKVSGANHNLSNSPMAISNRSSEAYRPNNHPPLHPNGTLIKTANDGKVYLLQNGQKRLVASENVLNDLYANGGFDFSDIVTVSADELNLYSEGEDVTGTLPSNGRSEPDGRLIRNPNGGEISIVTNNGQRRPFGAGYLELGYVYCKARDVSDYNSYPVGPIAGAMPVVTSGLTLSPGPYTVGMTVTASFTITNVGTDSITFNNLLVSGRLNGEIADFTNRQNVVLNPGQSYTYTGTQNMARTGGYVFYPAYKPLNGDWVTYVAADPGVVRSVNITVSASNDFSVTASPTTRTVVAGSPASYTVTTATTSGNPQTINLGVSGLPSNATHSFNPPSVTSGNSSTLTINTSSATPAGRYTLTVAASNGVTPRSTSTELVVTQPCTYTISPSSLSISSNGGSGSVNVTANSGCSWQANSNASWISIVSGNNGNGNGQVSYSIASNMNTNARSGTMTIAGQSFSVNQEGATPPATSSVQFSPITYSVSEETGRATIRVSRTGDLSGTVTVEYATADTTTELFNCNPSTEGQPSGARRGVATSRCDYTTSVGTLQFTPNETEKTFTIAITDDAHVEGDEAFTVSLRNPTGASLGATTSATGTIQDNDAAGAANPFNDNRFFARQQYLDFLGRAPSEAEIAGWANATQTNCADFVDDPVDGVCYDRTWIASVGFFQSVEFQQKGYFAYRFYKTLGGARLPTYREFIPDMVGLPDTSEGTKNSFAERFMLRADFQAAYPSTLTNDQFVDRLLERTGLATLDRARMKADLNAGAKTRAQILREAVESQEMFAREFNEAWVVMHYFAFLQRDGSASEYQGWKQVFDRNPADWRTVSYGFVNSSEYRNRFGQP